MKNKHGINRKTDKTRPEILVFGVGGAGNKVIKRLSERGIAGVKLIALETDKKTLNVKCGGITPIKNFILGERALEGAGSGGLPEAGEKAAVESEFHLKELMGEPHLVFIIAGMGGGTGTGASPVIAKTAKDSGAITIAIAILPFVSEEDRIEKAKNGIEKLRKTADAVIAVDNNKLTEYFSQMPKEDAYELLDDILSKTVEGIIKTIKEDVFICADFADIKEIMNSGEIATISFGTGTGPDKINQAVDGVTKFMMLEINPKEAKGGFIHITGGPELILSDVYSIESMIALNFPDEAEFVVGASINQDMKDKVEVAAVFTGIKK